jgi:hypothetical protein
MPAKNRVTDAIAPSRLTIRPGIGLGDIKFGVTASEVIERFGCPAADEIDDEGDRVVTFPKLGISFFAFDCCEEFRLTSFEVNQVSCAELWGQRVFKLSMQQMIELARRKTFPLEESHRNISKDEERLFQIRSQSLDFYFKGQKLVAVAGGVQSDEDGNVRWPS